MPVRDARHAMPLDAALGIALCGLDVLVFSAERTPVIAGYAVAGYAVFAWRRRRPVMVFGLLWLHAIAAAALLPDYRPTAGLMVALYTVAAYRDRRTAVLALAGAFVTSGIATAQEAASAPVQNPTWAVVVATAALYALLTLATWGVGRWARRSRRTVRDLHRLRAEAIADERARLSRELHDIVAHAVTMMMLQSAGARKIVAGEPARAEHALRNIEDLGAQAIAELRRLLQTLRTADTGDHHRRLDDLDELLAGSRAAGIDVDCTSEGAPGRLDPSVSLTAYRIVQESITNASKHAPGAPIRVRLTWTDRLALEICNGRPQGPAIRPGLSTGSGLVGLEQRVAVTGGDFAAGPAPDGGFRVRAVLPLTEVLAGSAVS